MELLDISTVKSKILPIVSVEDIPVEASMPNLVQLCQKTLLWNNDVRRFLTIFWPPWRRFFTFNVRFFGVTSDPTPSTVMKPHQNCCADDENRRKENSFKLQVKRRQTLPKDFAGEVGVVFDWTFWSLWIDNLYSGPDYGYALIAWKTTVEELKWFQQSFETWSSWTFRQSNQRFFQ